MARQNRIANALAITPARNFTHQPPDGRALVGRAAIPPAARAIVAVSLLCLGGVCASAQPKPQPPSKNQAPPRSQPAAAQKDQQQMRGLDEQIQEVKSDTLKIAAELNQLEEKLLYPSGTQVAVFVATGKGDTMRLDAVRLQIDGQLVAHYIYSFKELEALHKGGVQRLYVGNVATGDHQLEVLVEGKLENGADFSRTEKFAFRKDVKPKLVGLTLAGSDARSPITLGEW